VLDFHRRANRDFRIAARASASARASQAPCTTSAGALSTKPELLRRPERELISASTLPRSFSPLAHRVSTTHRFARCGEGSSSTEGHDALDQAATGVEGLIRPQVTPYSSYRRLKCLKRQVIQDIGLFILKLLT